MSLIEYLYLDEPRIDSYVQQIGPPIAYDKVPVWKAELGLTGPKASASQDRHARALTTREKITVLQKHLKDSKLVAESRPTWETSRRPWSRITEQVFVEEQCVATKIYLPPVASHEGSASGVTLWISSSVEESGGGLLCLLQDYHGSDSYPNNHYGESAYTVLESIIWTLHDQLPKLVLAEVFPKDDRRAEEDSSIDAWHRAAPHMYEFVSDPIAFLERNGCRPGRPRAIRTLYRIRDFGPECGQGREHIFMNSTSIFGYPIFIAAE